MELRDAVIALLDLEDTSKTRGSGRTRRMLIRLADKVLSSDKNGRSYVFFTHNQQWAADCRNKFLNILRRRVTRNNEDGELSFCVLASDNKVDIDSHCVYFTSDRQIFQGRNFTGVYEDHFSFELRLQAFLDSNP